jgi:hypothetical protein
MKSPLKEAVSLTETSMVLKKLTVKIPVELLREAVQATGLNQTQTIIEGLKEIVAQGRRHSLLNLKGKIDVKIDVKKLRDRQRTQ